jgi:hypothetical protein
MFRLWKVAYFTGGFAPLEDAVDAGGGGGDAYPTDGGDGSQPSDGSVDGEYTSAEGDAAVETEREEAPEDLLLDDEDDDQRSRPAEERVKALAKRNRKIRRQLAKLLPLSKRLEGVDLDHLVTSTRQYEQLAQQIRTNPRLRALLNGDAEPAQERRTPAREVEEQFDESQLPFDPNENPTNRYFADLARRNFEMNKQLKQLYGRVEGHDAREQQKTETQVREHWKNTILTASAQIKAKGVQAMFKDALASQFRDPDVRRKYTPQQLVGHYLAQLQQDGLITRAEATATARAAAAAAPARTAATQQRIAEHNKTLPRTVAVGGHPAPARSDKPSLASLRRKITGAAR